eukprot:353368-Pelagomonas_calceolata.AAC.1
MHFTGLLPDRAAQLEATCPPACIHVSKRVMECSGSPNDFVVAVTPGKSASKVSACKPALEVHGPRPRNTCSIEAGAG